MSSRHLISSPSWVSEDIEHRAPAAESGVEVIVTVGGVVVVLEVKGRRGRGQRKEEGGRRGGGRRGGGRRRKGAEGRGKRSILSFFFFLEK